MLDFLIVAVFCWLFFKAVGLAFKVAWGLTKIVASILFTIAVPLLIMGLLFAGGVVLLAPLGLVALSLGLLKFCV